MGDLASSLRDGLAGRYTIERELGRGGMATAYLETGEYETALDQLEPLLETPYNLSPGWLRTDPTLDPLRKNPRFQKLVESPA